MANLPNFVTQTCDISRYITLNSSQKYVGFATLLTAVLSKWFNRATISTEMLKIIVEHGGYLE